jgi:PmbA protein
VVFDSEIAGSVVGHLVSAINGSAIARKTSFLKDRLGERIFAPGITIVDDPLRRRGLRSRPFDAEGVAGQRMALIEDGVLKNWLLDSATARELGMISTGHAHRSTSSTPSPSATNLHMEPGAKSPEELIKDIDEGFYVTDLIGMGANMVTGDYSRGAAGFWIEKGQRTYPVSEVTIAGNLADMFKAVTPANDLQFRYGINAPTLRLEGLTIAGV